MVDLFNGRRSQEAVGLSINWLQIRAFGPYPSSILPHSHCYEAAIEPKSVLKHPNFRFSLYSPTVS
ncbi:hypothetical protein B5V00_11080 [Geothermobacter hydrogeniphilus]|uniref:Uncharacterized protein n=1 Tax=Geothermobacter hydrogeniphilus TaxID=1969733 RepID=A0A1X0Y1Z8_9BACT|nr:hypothetical protein B5V00_11080 [Geothermobacter hydrogeniphilus]